MDLTAVVSSASGSEDLWSSGPDGTRAWGANRLARLRKPPELSAFPHAGQSRHAIIPLSRCSRGLDHISISDLHDRFEGTVLFPYGPYDPSKLIGEGDGSLIVSSRSLTFECPDSETIRMLFVLGGPEDGPGAVNEQHTKVGIASF